MKNLVQKSLDLKTGLKNCVEKLSVKKLSRKNFVLKNCVEKTWVKKLC